MVETKRGTHTDDINVEAGGKEAVTCSRNGENHRCSPKVYWFVPDMVADALDHFIDTDIVDIVRRDDLETDNLFVRNHIGLTLFNLLVTRGL